MPSNPTRLVVKNSGLLTADWLFLFKSTQTPKPPNHPKPESCSRVGANVKRGQKHGSVAGLLGWRFHVGSLGLLGLAAGDLPPRKRILHGVAASKSSGGAEFLCESIYASIFSMCLETCCSTMMLSSLKHKFCWKPIWTSETEMESKTSNKALEGSPPHGWRRWRMLDMWISYPDISQQPGCQWKGWKNSWSPSSVLNGSYFITPWKVGSPNNPSN